MNLKYYLSAVPLFFDEFMNGNTDKNRFGNIVPLKSYCLPESVSISFEPSIPLQMLQ